MRSNISCWGVAKVVVNSDLVDVEIVSYDYYSSPQSFHLGLVTKHMPHHRVIGDTECYLVMFRSGNTSYVPKELLNL